MLGVLVRIRDLLYHLGCRLLTQYVKEQVKHVVLAVIVYVLCVTMVIRKSY